MWRRILKSFCILGGSKQDPSWFVSACLVLHFVEVWKQINDDSQLWMWVPLVATDRRSFPAWRAGGGVGRRTRRAGREWQTGCAAPPSPASAGTVERRWAVAGLPCCLGRQLSPWAGRHAVPCRAVPGSPVRPTTKGTNKVKLRTPCPLSN